LNAKRFLAGLCVIVLLGAGAPSSYPGGEDDLYVNIARAYFDLGFQLNPTGATCAGVHTYDAQLGDYSAAAWQRELAIDRQYLTKLAGLDKAKLSPEVAIDEKILEN